MYISPLLKTVGLGLISLFILLSNIANARLTNIEYQLLTYDCDKGDQTACNATLSARLMPYDYVTANAKEDSAKYLTTEIAAKRRTCENDNIADCTKLGILLYNQNHQDNTEAYDILITSCDNGDGVACDLIAQINSDLIYSAAENPNFLNYYHVQREQCATSNQSACATQARLNAILPDVIPDQTIWYQQMMTACDAGIARACANISYILSPDSDSEYEILDENNMRQSPIANRRAFRYAKKACRLNNPMGCWNAALDYDDRSHWDESHPLFTKACTLGMDTACDEMNYEIYWYDDDPDERLEPACKKGDFTACRILEYRRYDTAREFVDSEAYDAIDKKLLSNLIEICKMGSWIACGDAAVWSRRFGDIDNAERLAHLVCYYDIANACTVLGNIYKFDQNDKEGHLEQSIDYLQRACDLGAAAGCNNLGDSYEKGLGVSQSLGRAVRLFTLACNKDLAIGCKNLAETIEETQGIEQARPHWQKACDLESKYCEADIDSQG